MSLVIARQIENDICLVSDTKLTPKEKYDDRLSSDLKDNILKIVIINPQLVFAFAGAPVDAEEALKQIKEHHTINEIKEIIYSSHKASFRNGNYDVEFILACGEPNFEIIEFKKGIQEKVLNSWLGLKKGFDLFQEFMNTETNVTNREVLNSNQQKRELQIKKTESSKATIKVSFNFEAVFTPTDETKANKPFGEKYSKVLSSMKKVIESGQIKEVGGFYTPVAYHEGAFHYIHYSSIFAGEQIIELSESNESSQVLSFGSPQGGAYSVTLLEFKNELNEQIATFHFLHGQLGIIYERYNSGLSRPAPFRNHDSIDFSFVIKDKFNLEEPPIMPVGFSLDNFGINGTKYLKEKKYDIALERLNWGIIKCKKDQNLWKLYDSRARVYMQAKRYLEAINDFNSIFEQVPFERQEQFFNSRGLAFANIGKYELAIKDFSNTLKINQSRSDTLFSRAICYYHIALNTKSKAQLVLARKDLQQSEILGYTSDQFTNLKKNIQQLESLPN